MQVERFLSAMHPAAEHNYAVDFTSLLEGINGSSEVITGVPTVAVVGTPPPGFTVVYGGLDATLKKVIFAAQVSSGSHTDAAYANKGATVCIQVTVATTSSPAEIQIVELVVVDPCI